MQKKRIFIAINLPEKVKEKLSKYRYDIPAKWTKKENLHITLNFLGQIGDEEIPDIFQAVEKTVLNHSALDIKIKKIAYGPKYKIVWAVGERIEKLSALKNDLEENLKNFDNKGFTPHITLARIRAWDFRKIEEDERPEIDEEIDLNIQVNSIEIMESVLKREGPEYTILESFQLDDRS